MSENCNYAPVEKVILIDDRRIEIYWGEQMRRADNENDYLVKYKGKVQELVHWTSDMTWDYGTVYQKESMRTTLSLVHPVDPECAGEVTVQIVGKLTDVKDRPADNEKVYQTVYQPYYVVRKKGTSGIVVKAGEKTTPAVVDKALAIIDMMLEKICDVSQKLALELGTQGLVNIQYLIYHNELYVIEVNPRASRTIPYISKVTGIPIVALAAKVITGAKIRDLGYEPGLQKESEYYAVKKPVFSFEKLRGAEISLGPEMKSTGECLGISKNFHEALYKAFLGAGVNLPKYKKMILTVKDSDKIDAIDIGRRFEALGYEIFSTKSTCRVLNEAGVHAKQINKLEEESPNLLDLILDDKIDLVIDTPSQGVGRSRDGFLIRRYAIETGVTCLTSLDTADALLTSLETGNRDQLSVVDIAQI